MLRVSGIIAVHVTLDYEKNLLEQTYQLLAQDEAGTIVVTTFAYESIEEMNHVDLAHTWRSIIKEKKVFYVDLDDNSDVVWRMRRLMLKIKMKGHEPAGQVKFMRQLGPANQETYKMIVEFPQVMKPALKGVSADFYATSSHSLLYHLTVFLDEHRDVLHKSYLKPEVPQVLYDQLTAEVLPIGQYAHGVDMLLKGKYQLAAADFLGLEKKVLSVLPDLGKSIMFAKAYGMSPEKANMLAGSKMFKPFKGGGVAGFDLAKKGGDYSTVSFVKGHGPEAVVSHEVLENLQNKLADPTTAQHALHIDDNGVAWANVEVGGNPHTLQLSKAMEKQIKDLLHGAEASPISLSATVVSGTITASKIAAVSIVASKLAPATHAGMEFPKYVVSDTGVTLAGVFILIKETYLRNMFVSLIEAMAEGFAETEGDLSSLFQLQDFAYGAGLVFSNDQFNEKPDTVTTILWAMAMRLSLRGGLIPDEDRLMWMSGVVANHFPSVSLKQLVPILNNLPSLEQASGIVNVQERLEAADLQLPPTYGAGWLEMLTEVANWVDAFEYMMMYGLRGVNLLRRQMKIVAANGFSDPEMYTQNWVISLLVRLNQKPELTTHQFGPINKAHLLDDLNLAYLQLFDDFLPEVLE
jgi:hypothetical protein